MEKKIKNNSLIDKIFIIVFFIFLIIPVLHIDTKSLRSLSEYKDLTVFKPFINDKGKINFNFGKDFDNWYSDRFNLRLKIIFFYNWLNIHLFNQNSIGYYDFKNGSFLRNEEVKHFDTDIITSLKDCLVKFNDYCNKKGIKLYILITPSRSDIYIYNKKLYNQECSEFTIKYFEKLNKENNLRIIYPIRELREAAKENLTYYKTDIHWTEDGAYIGYKELMKYIKKDFPNIKTLNENDFNYSYNNQVSSLPFIFNDFGYTFAPLGLTDNDKKQFKKT